MIYLDYNATSPVRKEVTDAVSEVSEQFFGNPSSMHKAGQQARHVLNSSRRIIAGCLGAAQEEIIFTSGGTEANNLAILGAVKELSKKGNHLITTKIEHEAVLHVFKHLEENGYKLDYIEIDKNGKVDLEQYKSLFTDETILVSAMYANNENGIILPAEEMAKIANDNDVIFHTDAVQAAGKINIDLQNSNISILAISAHKIGGPKGVGALYVKRGSRISNIVFGGSHERRLRPGTENLTGIKGFATAFQIAFNELDSEQQKIKELRDEFERRLFIDNIIIVGEDSERLCNTSNIIIPDLSGDLIVQRMDLKGVCISTGAACSSAEKEPSHVLSAMGFSRFECLGGIRISFGFNNTLEDAIKTAELLSQIITDLRSIEN